MKRRSVEEILAEQHERRMSLGASAIPQPPTGRAAKLTARKIAEARKLRALGLTQAEIGTRLGLSVSTAARAGKP
ncbi:MAG: hypothetical protein Q8K32_31285 [Archangium sp.]|nr:hypothetical protein [Archangium sp.]